MPFNRIARGNNSPTFSTASAGNFAQGLAWVRRQIGRGAIANVPDTVAASKRDALCRLGAEIVDLPFEEFVSDKLADAFKASQLTGLRLPDIPLAMV